MRDLNSIHENLLHSIEGKLWEMLKEEFPTCVFCGGTAVIRLIGAGNRVRVDKEMHGLKRLYTATASIDGVQTSGREQIAPNVAVKDLVSMCPGLRKELAYVRSSLYMSMEEFRELTTGYDFKDLIANGLVHDMDSLTLPEALIHACVGTPLCAMARALAPMARELGGFLHVFSFVDDAFSGQCGADGYEVYEAEYKEAYNDLIRRVNLELRKRKGVNVSKEVAR